MIEQILINGILLSGIYAIISIGLNIIYGVLKIINFAHGDFLMLAMYVAYWLTALYGFDVYASIPIVSIAMILFGYVISRLLIEPILKDPELNQIVITLALSIILQNIALILWKADFRSLHIGASINIGGIFIPTSRLIASIGALSMVFLLYLTLIKTRFGIRVRAVAQSPEISELSGVNSKHVRISTFILGTLLVSVAGVMILPIYSVYPTVGLEFGMISWIIIVFGGLGSVTGALVASFIVGITESVVGAFYNIELARALMLILFVIILFVRPSGIFGERARV